MKIARYIGDLLYDYECVVIPGLGGFLTHDKPSSIQPNTHHFRPPYKQVMFNAYLKTNDGLLVNYIAREENISYKEAKAQVDKFVYLCDNALKAGKRIHFHKVGSLHLNKNGILVFEQDHTINYNADAFGLTSFVSPAVRRATPEEKLRKAMGSEKKTGTKPAKKEDKKPSVSPPAVERKHKKLIATKRKSPYRTQLAFLTLLILAMLTGWGFMNKEQVSAYYNNYSSVIPLFYTQPNAYLINNIDKVPVTKVSSSRFGSWWVHLFETGRSTAEKTSPRTEKKSPEARPVVSKVAKKVPAVKAKESTPLRKTANKVSPARDIAASPAVRKAAAKTPSPQPATYNRHFYIIAGAFKSTGNVKHLVYSLKKKGYDALVAGTTATGLHRVAFGVYATRPEAEKQLQAIRRQGHPSAWILVQ